jgi:hypothetical protein
VWSIEFSTAKVHISRSFQVIEWWANDFLPHDLVNRGESLLRSRRHRHPRLPFSLEIVTAPGCPTISLPGVEMQTLEMQNGRG